MQTKNNSDLEPILFYDSYCVLCNRFIKLLLHIDKKAKIKLAPINGENYNQLFNQSIPISLPDSILLFTKYGIYYKSQAAFKTLKLLGFPYSALIIINILPTFLLDFLYDSIATNRYKFFGKYDSCPIIPLEFKNRFLP